MSFLATRRSTTPLNASQEPQLEHKIQARPTLEHLTRTLPHTALSENKAAPTLEEEGKGEGRGGGGRGNSRIVLVHRGPGRFPWVQDMEKCPRRVNAVLPCRRVPNEAIDSNANAPAIDSKDRHRLDKSRYMQGERQTCAEKEVQSVSAIKLQSSATRRRKKTELQTRRRVILCDVASPWSRPCSRRLAHSSQSVPHDALGLSWTALRARTRPCQTRPPPVHTSAALAPNTKKPSSGGCALQAHAHRVFRTAPKPAIRPIRRRGRADPVGAGRGAVSLATARHASMRSRKRLTVVLRSLHCV